MRLTRVKAFLEAGRHGGFIATSAMLGKLLQTVTGGRGLRANDHEAGGRPESRTDAAANDRRAATRAELEAAVAQAQAEWKKASDELDRQQIGRDKAKADWERIVNCQNASDDRRMPDIDRRKADEALGKLVPNQRAPDVDRRKTETALAAFVRTVAERHAAFVERESAETAWSNAASDLISAISKRKKAIAALEELNRAEGKR